jgi:hypothetical protein
MTVEDGENRNKRRFSSGVYDTRIDVDFRIVVLLVLCF